MYEAKAIATGDKTTLYAELIQQAEGLMHGESNVIANAANFAALVYDVLPDLNWAGFYLLAGTELVAGPLQGKPACIRIPLGPGACRTAAQHCPTPPVPHVPVSASPFPRAAPS